MYSIRSPSYELSHSIGSRGRAVGLEIHVRHGADNRYRDMSTRKSRIHPGFMFKLDNHFSTNMLDWNVLKLEKKSQKTTTGKHTYLKVFKIK